MVTVEYWLVTRAEVFRRFAEQAQEAATAVASAGEKADDCLPSDGQIDVSNLNT